MGHEDFDWGACLAGVRDRDEDAARTLVDRLYPLVSKLVRAHLVRGDDEQDLIQDTFLKVFTRLDQYRGTVPFEHWVSRVAVSTSLDRLRSHRRKPVVRFSDLSEEQQVMMDSISAPADTQAPSDRLAWEVLERLLASLDPKDRLLIRLLELEQKTIAEVCELTGWNSGVVRIRAFRARHRLKSLYLELERTTA